MWTAKIHDTISGSPIIPVELSDVQWDRRLAGTGRAGSVIQLGDQEHLFDHATVEDICTTNARTLVLSDGDHVVYAGLVLGGEYERATGRLELKHVELRHIWSQRMTFGVYNYQDGDLTVSGRSHGGAVRAIVARGMQWGGIWPLPVDLPPDGVGGFSAEWKNYQALLIEDLLQQVEKEGVEVDFRPYLTAAGNLRWETRVGSPITGATTVLNVTAPESPVVGLKVKFDGSKQLTGVFYGGNGTEADMLTAGTAGYPGPLSPVRDAFRSAKDVTDLTRLQALAAADLAANRAPIRQLSFEVVVGEALSAADVQPGSIVPLEFYGDSFMSDGAYPHRVVAVSGGTGNRLRLEVQKHG